MREGEGPHIHSRWLSTNFPSFSFRFFSFLLFFSRHWGVHSQFKARENCWNFIVSIRMLFSTSPFSLLSYFALSFLFSSPFPPFHLLFISYCFVLFEFHRYSHSLNVRVRIGCQWDEEEGHTRVCNIAKTGNKKQNKSGLLPPLSISLYLLLKIKLKSQLSKCRSVFIKKQKEILKEYISNGLLFTFSLASCLSSPVPLHLHLPLSLPVSFPPSNS